MSTGEPFDPGAWVDLLDRHGVQVVVVGGYAGVLHGAQRPTLDIDVVPRWEQDNLERLCRALREVDAVSVSGPRTTGDQITPAVLVEREVMNWKTAIGRIDTLVGIPDHEGMPVDFHQLLERAIVLPINSLEIPVASLDDVITSKEFASRRKDAEALPELRRLRAAQMGETPHRSLPGKQQARPSRAQRRPSGPEQGFSR